MNHPIPFRGAIFDLDGTVLDSLGVWHHVDQRFFGARGIPIPEDYVRAIAGMSFLETAEYTVKACGLHESVEDVMAEWLALAADEYAHDVELVPGARAYLRMLKREGVRLAAATANRLTLVEPALTRLGIRELFEAILTTGDIGDRNKSDGALFQMAAARLHVPPAECAVFEDTLEGIRGARAAGMGAYAVKSIACAHHLDEIAPLADAVIEDFSEMRQIHPFPDGNRRCVIFTAYCEGDPATFCAAQPGDLVLCADMGWYIAQKAGFTPDIVIGDFDSGDAPDSGLVERHPVEKDDTDTMLCVKKGLALGYDDFLIVGGFGGRLDHTLANLQSLLYAVKRGARARMQDGRCRAEVTLSGRVTVPKTGGTLSVFAMGDVCRGVSIKGTKYDAENLTLTNSFPIGAGNSVIANEAEIAVREGALLVMTCGE